MPLYAIILISIVGGIFGLWLLYFLTHLIYSLEFKRRIKKSSKSVNIGLVQRVDTISKICDYCAKIKVNLSKNDVFAIKNLNYIEDYQLLDKETRNYYVLGFVRASHNILTIIENSSNLTDEFVSLSIEYNEVEEMYRQKVALYNSDVIGFNYWVSGFGVRFILSKIFKLNPFDLIV